MSETMHLICLKDTGHILAAVTATTGGDPDLEALVGDALPVANTREDVDERRSSLIPVDVLELKSVPLDNKVIGAPLMHVVDGGRVEKLPPPVATDPTTELSGKSVDIKNGQLGRKVLAIVSEIDDPRAQWRVQSGEVTAGAGGNAVDPLVIDLSVMPNDTPADIIANNAKEYLVMTAYEGIRLTWVKETPN